MLSVLQDSRLCSLIYFYISFVFLFFITNEYKMNTMSEYCQCCIYNVSNQKANLYSIYIKNFRNSLIFHILLYLTPGLLVVLFCFCIITRSQTVAISNQPDLPYVLEASSIALLSYTNKYKKEVEFRLNVWQINVLGLITT